VAGVSYAAASAARVGDLGPLDGWRASQHGDRPFTPAAWRGADPAARGRMLASLATQHRLVGLPRDSVVALLGPGQCYVLYDDEPCYWLLLGGQPTQLAFGVNHSDAPGRIVSVSLER
jgi:hypothetical protein